MLPLFVLCMVVTAANGQGFLHSSNGKIVDGNGRNVLLRGIGLGGWMLQEGYMLQVKEIGQQQHVIREHIQQLVGENKTQAFYDAWLSNHTTRADIEALKKWGFNSVRLPMHYDLYTLPVPGEKERGKNTWLSKGFAMTDSLLAWCRDNQVYLVLDLHAAPGGQGHDLNISDADTAHPFLWQSDENQQKTIALWRELAARYRNEPWIGAYDIINEPNWGFADPEDRNGLNEKGNEPLKKLLMGITAAIRSVDKNHLVIIEGNGWGNNYNGILPPWDDNMALSFHKYWNFNTQASIQQFLDFREKYNIPIWLGESGENSNVWFTEAISLMEKNNIGWCWWPLKKIGINNPLEIRSNDNYDKILAWWSGSGEKPGEAEAFKGLMTLAESTNFKNNIIHRDVLDAMFRQIHSKEAIPYEPRSATGQLSIPVVNYDLGSIGVSYYDLDSADYHISNGERGGNRGRAYRNDGVDIRRDSLGWYVSDIEDGEWLQYTLRVPIGRKYVLQFTVASPCDDGAMVIKIPEASFSQTIAVPNTGDAHSWQHVTSTPVTLSKGDGVLTVHFTKGGFNLREIVLVKQD